MGKYVGGLIPLGVLLTAVTFIVSVVVYFRREREPDELHQRFLARFYVYVMLFFSVLLVFIGSVFLLRGVLSYPFGLSFSYTGSVVLKDMAKGEQKTVKLGELVQELKRCLGLQPNSNSESE